MMSVAPPGVVETMILIGLVGKICAQTELMPMAVIKAVARRCWILIASSIVVGNQPVTAGTARSKAHGYPPDHERAIKLFTTPGEDNDYQCEISFRSRPRHC